MSKIQDAAKAMMELKEQVQEIKHQIFRIPSDRDLIAEIAIEVPECIIINWNRLANPRHRG